MARFAIPAQPNRRVTQPDTGGTRCGRTAWARRICAVFAVAMFAMAPAGAQQMQSFDPDEAYEKRQSAEQTQSGSQEIDGDLSYPAPVQSARQDAQTAGSAAPTPDSGYEAGFPAASDQPVPDEPAAAAPTDGQPVPAQAESGTYGQDDLIGAAEGVFGEGAEGLARIIEDLLREQGEPNGYIVGREAGGAFIFGARYGSGTLHHQIEGQRKIYWTGPSLGFDAGANAGNTFVLVYNLYDTQDLFRRYPAGEGQAYLVGGLHASYMRRGDVVLIPIRMGAGLRLGINAGYMRFSEKQRWLPF